MGVPSTRAVAIRNEEIRLIWLFRVPSEERKKMNNRIPTNLMHRQDTDKERFDETHSEGGNENETALSGFEVRLVPLHSQTDNP